MHLDRQIARGGVPRILHFPFAFDTPNLLTGHAVYRPTVGDVLLDAWFEIDTAWDGTTPQGDFGVFSMETNGLFEAAVNPVSMDQADSEYREGLLNQVNASTDLLVRQVALSTLNLFTQGGAQRRARVVPAKLKSGVPLKVCVSQDGSAGGADPGSTQGKAVLYLVVATPA